MPARLAHHLSMDRTALETLAANLRALMGAREELRTQARVGAKAGMDQRTVGRILNREHAPTLPQLDGLARAFGLEPWQLLVPGFDPLDMPVCVPGSQRAAFDQMRLAAEALAKYRT
jgi:transcriptional regulator with XRE-family HTH domain